MVKKARKPLRQRSENDGGVIDDPRFASMHTAPLFKKQPKDSQKFTLDKRFEAVLTDERFQAPQPEFDKYGRKAKRQDGGKKSDLGDMYKLEQSAESRLEYLNRLARGEIEDSDSDSDQSADNEARVRTRTTPEGEDDEHRSGSEKELDGDDDEDYDSVSSEDEQHTISLLRINNHPVEYGDATTRLAVMNCDWQHMKAADVYALLQSFCPSGSSVKGVVVYVSDFGKERLEQEATLGPQAIWQQEQQNREHDGQVDDAVDAVADEDISKELADVQLRKYELEKLSYYFAIAECDDLSTANVLYDQLNGIEVGYSSVQLDLRFVPDDVSFEGRTVRDKANAIPEEYTAPEFVSQALQSSKVRCTWDEPELGRNQKLTNFTKWRDLKESDFQVYLASESEEESDKEADKRSSLRKLLLAGSDDEGEADDGGRDAFFMNDGSSDEERSVEDPTADFEDGWGAAGSQHDDEVVHEFTYIPKSQPVNTNSKKALKKAKKQQQQQQEQQTRKEKNDSEDAAAAALLAESDAAADSTTAGKRSKKKGKGKKKRKAAEADEDEAAGFGVDVHDPRFAAVVEGDERFGIDRTDKSFKETDGMRALLAEQRKRKQQKTRKGSK